MRMTPISIFLFSKVRKPSLINGGQIFGIRVRSPIFKDLNEKDIKTKTKIKLINIDLTKVVRIYSSRLVMRAVFPVIFPLTSESLIRPLSSLMASTDFLLVSTFYRTSTLIVW